MQINIKNQTEIYYICLIVFICSAYFSQFEPSFPVDI